MSTMKNKVQLIGKAGKDVEIKDIGNGRKLAKFSLVITEAGKDSLGQKKLHSQWYNLVAWGGLAVIAGKLIRKGTEFAVEGKLTNRIYEDPNGIRKYFTEIVVNDLHLISLLSKINKNLGNASIKSRLRHR